MRLDDKQEKILFTGGTSLLAYLWANARAAQNEILLIEHVRKLTSSFWPVEKFNLNDSSRLAGFLNEQQVDIVVNTVALTSIEECEREQDLALHLNAKLPVVIAKACRLARVKMIHISTDHLYGVDHNCFTEEEPPILMNTYASTKYEGEQGVMAEYPSSLICRTNFYGPGPSYRPSFSDKVILSLRNQTPMPLFNDVCFSPIPGSKLAQYAHELIDKNASGIFNISSDDYMTKYDFGLELALHLGLSANQILSSRLTDRNDLVSRPTAMVLSNQKAITALGHSLGKITDHIKLI